MPKSTIRQTGGLAVGKKGFSSRLESRFDVPINYQPGSAKNLTELYIQMRAGNDQFSDLHLFGTSATLGVRYHSAGFIAELAIKFTKTPEELDRLKP